MNPTEQPATGATVGPGTEMLRTVLGLTPGQLASRHAPASVEGQLARLTAEAAVRLDELAAKALGRAGRVTAELASYARGTDPYDRPCGVLQASAVEIDVLAARATDAHATLDALCRACLRSGAVQPPVTGSPRTPAAARATVPAAVPARAAEHRR